jgi:hypothetical protein
MINSNGKIVKAEMKQFLEDSWVRWRDSAQVNCGFVDSCNGPFVMFLTRTRFATPGTNVVRRENGERGRGILTLLLTVAGVQNNAWPVIGFAIALELFELLSSRGEDEDERRRPGRNLSARTKFNFNQADQFQNTRPQPNIRVGHVHSTKMSSEDDSDVPEQVSLSTSKQQAIGRKKDVAKELAQANRSGRNITGKGTVN